MKFCVLFIGLIYSFSVLSIDCVSVMRSPLPIKDTLEYQETLWQCRQAINVLPRILGNTTTNWGLSSASEVSVESCKENFSSIKYSKDYLDKVLTYSPAKQFKEEIHYLINNDRKFESWGDLMRIEAISHMMNAGCENSKRPISLAMLKNCDRFSKGIDNFKCSQRQKTRVTDEQILRSFENAKKLLNLNAKKFQLINQKKFLEIQIREQFKLSGQVLCGDRVERSSRDILYDTYKAQFENITDIKSELQRLQNLKDKQTDSFQRNLIQRDIDALKFILEYEAQMRQLIADQTSDNPQVLIDLNIKRQRLKEVENKIDLLNQKIILASTAAPFLFAGIEQRIKITDQDLKSIYPLSKISELKQKPSIKKLREIFQIAHNIIERKITNSIDMLCDPSQIDAKALLGMTDVRSSLRNHFPTYEGLSSCIENKIGATELMTNTALSIGCTIGAVIPMTSLYSIGSCAGYFVTDSASQLLQSVDNLRFANDCRITGSEICSEKDFDRSFGEFKENYNMFIFSFITDVGLEAVGLGAINAINRGITRTIDGAIKLNARVKRLFEKIKGLRKIKSKELRQKRLDRILSNLDDELEVVVRPEFRESRARLVETAPSVRAQMDQASRSIDPAFAKAMKTKVLPKASEVLEILKDADPALARVTSEFYLQNIDGISPDILIKIIDEVVKRKVTPTEFIELLNYKVIKELRANSDAFLDNLIETIRSFKTKRAGIDLASEHELRLMDTIVPGKYLPQYTLGKHGGVRQVFKFNEERLTGLIQYTDFDANGNLILGRYTDIEGIMHQVPTPHRWIEIYGEYLTDNFFGMKRVGKNTYSYADASELNANIKRFNEIVGADSELSIDSRYYHMSSMKHSEGVTDSIGSAVNVLAEASQRTIDEIANGFGWPVGHRDIFQIHDIGAHSSLMLLDKRLIKVAQTKAQDVVDFRNFIDTLQLTTEQKDSLKYLINSSAGPEFESIGVTMNFIYQARRENHSLKTVNMARQYFMLRVFDKVKDALKAQDIKIPKSAMRKMLDHISKLDTSAYNFTERGLLDIAQRKLDIIFEQF